MNRHETALVTVLLERLKKVDSAPDDSEAETLIRESTADQPHATYYLVQTVLMQDLSLHVAQNRIAELEKSAAEAQKTFLPPGLLLDESNRIAQSAAEAKTTAFLPPGLLLDKSNSDDRKVPGTP